MSEGTGTERSQDAGAATAIEQGAGGHRFRSAYDNESLFEALAEIARFVDPVIPESVSQRAYDEAREPAGHLRAPSARQTVARLGAAMGWSWRELLERSLAHSPHWMARSLARTQNIDSGLERSEAVGTLRLVARRLGLSSPRPEDYTRSRRELLGADRRRHRHGRRLRLPTWDQIGYVCGGWDNALKLAGLERVGSQPRHSGLPFVVVLELHLKWHGCLPSRRTTWHFTRTEGLAMQDLKNGQRWGDVLVELRRKRAAKGLWCPPELPRQRDRPDYSSPCPKDAEALAELEEIRRNYPEQSRRRALSIDLELCKRAMRQFLIGLPAGETATQKRYCEWKRPRPEYPWPESFRKFGTFSGIRKQVQLEMRREGRFAGLARERKPGN